MTVTDEAVEAARQARHRVRWERMKRMIEGDRRALGEREPGDPPDMQEDARAALEAAAPHMLFAPEGVSEAERALRDLCSWLDHWDRRDNNDAKNIKTVLSALSSERERAERLAEERERLHLLICGGEDAPGYAASLTFDEVKAAHDDYIAMLKSNAQAAEAKVKELEAPFDWTAEDLVDLMAEAIMDAIDMDTNATDYARAALIALNKEGLLRPNDYREPQQ